MSEGEREYNNESIDRYEEIEGLNLEQFKKRDQIRKLMAEILDRAVKIYRRKIDLKTHYSVGSPVPEQHPKEVERWLFEEEDDYVFSFKNICEYLGLNFEAVRKKLREEKMTETRQKQ